MALDGTGGLVGFHGGRHFQAANQQSGQAMLLDLRAGCQPEMVRKTTPDHETALIPAAVVNDNRPGISPDGLVVSWWRKARSPGGRPDPWYGIFLEGRALELGDSSRLEVGESRTPRPHVVNSADVGITAWVMDESQGPGGVGPSSSKFWSLAAGINGPATSCHLDDVVPPATQPAFSANGRIIVAEFANETERYISRWQRPVGSAWCIAAGAFVLPGATGRMDLARLNPHASPVNRDIEGTHAITVSADGRVAAWTSYVDHCQPTTPYNPGVLRDLWLWYDVGLTPSPLASQVCDALEGGGKLARFAVDPSSPTDESLAVLSPDASAVILISDGEPPGAANPANVPVLYHYDLASGAALQLSPVELDPQVATERITFAALSGDGKVVAYVRGRTPAPPRAPVENLDLFAVRLDRPSAALTDDTFGRPPPDDPFDVQMLTCTASGGTVEVVLRLRQGEGPKRTVLVSAEATGSLATALLGPVVQQVSAGQTVDVALSAPFTGSVATCAGRAIDSSRQHPDVVAAWVQP